MKAEVKQAITLAGGAAMVTLAVGFGAGAGTLANAPAAPPMPSTSNPAPPPPPPAPGGTYGGGSGESGAAGGPGVPVAPVAAAGAAAKQSRGLRHRAADFAMLAAGATLWDSLPPGPESPHGSREDW